jgi:hypothetical protein
VLASQLSDALTKKISLQLGPLIKSVIKGLQEDGHELAPERPWSVGEFAYSDPTLGESGLRVAFDLVVSVGFADRSSVDDQA